MPSRELLSFLSGNKHNPFYLKITTHRHDSWPPCLNSTTVRLVLIIIKTLVRRLLKTLLTNHLDRPERFDKVSTSFRDELAEIEVWKNSAQFPTIQKSDKLENEKEKAKEAISMRIEFSGVALKFETRDRETCCRAAAPTSNNNNDISSRAPKDWNHNNNNGYARESLESLDIFLINKEAGTMITKATFTARWDSQIARIRLYSNRGGAKNRPTNWSLVNYRPRVHKFSHPDL